MRKDFVSKVEEMKDIEELIEAKRKVLKTWRIVNVITFCIFLVIILIRCSAGLNRGTVITDNPAPPTKTIRVARIDIGVNKDFDVTSLDLYKDLVSGNLPYEDDKENHDTSVHTIFDKVSYTANDYYVKSADIVLETTESSVVIDESLGVSGFQTNQYGELRGLLYGKDTTDYIAEGCSGRYTEGYNWLWKYDDTVEYDTTFGGSAAFVFNTSNLDLDKISKTIETSLDNQGIPYNYLVRGFCEECEELHIPDTIYNQIDMYYLAGWLKPELEQATNLQSNLYGFDYRSFGTDAQVHECINDYEIIPNNRHRNAGYRGIENLVVSTDESTDDIFVVIVNIDGFYFETIGGTAYATEVPEHDPLNSLIEDGFQKVN